MICVLYKAYRRSNDSFVASFHSKMVFSVAVVCYLLDLYLIATGILKWIDFELSSSKVLIGLFILLPVNVVVHLITLKHEYYEEYELNDNEYKRGWFCFICFFLAGLFTFFYLPLTYKK